MGRSRNVEMVLLGAALVAILAFVLLPSLTWPTPPQAMLIAWGLLTPLAVVLMLVVLVLQKRRGVKHVWETTALSKTTVLDGHYASGDCECFCFDTHDPEFDHGAALRAWMTANPEPSNADVPEELVDDSCRVYPNSLIPEGVERRKGRWTITVAFEPEES